MSRPGQILLGLGVSIIVICSVWFFVLYNMAYPESLQMMPMGVENKTRDVNIDYNFEYGAESLKIISESESKRDAIIDVSGILTGIIVGTVVGIIGKVTDRVLLKKIQ